MDTNKLKKFATEARNRLKVGIAVKITTLGFDKNGNVPEHMQPQLMQGGTLWNGRLETEGFYHQWIALYTRIQQKGIKEVYEEAAYTWFNRLVAIRILMKNGLIEPVLAYVDEARTPRIVDEARMGRMPQMPERQRVLLMELLDDDSKTTEQFAILVTAFCHDNPILYKCFGIISDYTELLLPNDILTEGGFVDMLNHTEFITDNDFKSPELIGWLYQFYISERKDEVFAKKGKYDSDEIPAATEIFTPNWIVKYMVQNTIGRIYLDNNPSAAPQFKPKWDFLVEPSIPTPKDAIYNYNELTDLLVGDLACGSGHILNECFDILYDLYLYEGYSRSEAIENIFRYNLRGVDLDTRSKQLSMFALLLKACQKDKSFVNAYITPYILDMPVFVPLETAIDHLHLFFHEEPTVQQAKELTAAFELIQKAVFLGSIMKFNISETTLLHIKQSLNYWQKADYVPEEVIELMPVMNLITALTDKYAVLVMNPPYMKSGRFSAPLSDYIKKNYVSGRTDLFAIFMMVAKNKLDFNGKLGMINMQSWMFIKTYQSIREMVITDLTIDSMLQLGPRLFDEIGGEVVKTTSFVITQNTNLDHTGYFVNLSDGESCEEKKLLFLNRSKTPYYIPQRYFLDLPEMVLGYWLSDNIRDLFKNENVTTYSTVCLGMTTADNDKFLRLWFEINNHKANYTATSLEKFNNSSKKWAPYNKGGEYRKWYGNLDYLVNWEDDGYEIRNFCDSSGHIRSTVPNTDFYFRECITWSKLVSKGAFRYRPIGSIFDVAGPSIYLKNRKHTNFLLGFLNSAVANEFLKLFDTTNFEGGQISKLPLLKNKLDDGTLFLLVNQCVEISKLDWDKYEFSWDFQASPIFDHKTRIEEEGETADLGETTGLLENQVINYKNIWEDKFYQLHSNEEELNRQFIEIYGLQEELKPDVPLDEITILQQGEISLHNGQIVWHDDVLIKQLISYAVGVWMGRYRLDKPGINIAHPNPTTEELAPYSYDGERVYIDDDGLIPILPHSSPFDDNLSSRIVDFIRISFGEHELTENLNYMEQALGTTISNYVLKDYWKDHKKMYQNRPIYWLFSSSKGAFKCLAYMHRMDAYTAERVRSNYLLPYIEFLQNQIGELENRAATLSTAENRKLLNFQKDLDECREYHERLQVVAERAIAFDLDDGVLVNYAKFGDVLEKIK